MNDLEKQVVELLMGSGASTTEVIALLAKLQRIFRLVAEAEILKAEEAGQESTVRMN